MMDLAECLASIFAVSLCAWGLIYIFSNLQLRKFIVSRYKEETNLSQTAFFRNHVPFVLYLPDFLSAGFFGTHLMMCVWGWQFFGKRKVFIDIENPNLVIQHFSRKEIRKVKWVLMSGLILFAHGIAYYILLSIFPEVFSS
jgi:hypothetical protein